MAYSQALVVAGGIAHVPIVITILRFLDGKTSGIYNAKKAVADKAKAIEEEAKAKAAAAAKAEAAKAAAEAKAAAAANAAQQESQDDIKTE